MNKSEAISAIQKGSVVTHRFFGDNEFIKLHSNGIDYEDENGYKLNSTEFWHHRKNPMFETDWSVKDLSDPRDNPLTDDDSWIHDVEMGAR